MSDKKQEQLIIQSDFKKLQREQNYRRAEAFLLWKLGPAYDQAMRFLRGSGMDWPSLFVEFVEKVEEDLLKRTRVIEEMHTKSVSLQFNPTAIPDIEMFKYPLAPKDDPFRYSREELEKFRKEENAE